MGASAGTKIAMSPQRLFSAALIATLAIKLLLAYVLPMSGDEAYFLVWAKHLDFGYYDHPPMVGWMLHGLLYLGSSELWLRLPAILLSSIIGIGIYQLLKPWDEVKAALLATLFLVSPIALLNVLITTDTPLILFVFLSVVVLFKAMQRDLWYGYVASGVLLGLAFLSKYFAVLLILGYLAFFMVCGRNKQKAYGLFLLLLAALPFALLNFYWNYTHCWDNILFNLYNRNEGEHFAWSKVATFWGMQLYLIGPLLAYYLFKRVADFRYKIAQSGVTLFAYVFLVPMTLFALLSFKNDIGLHWVLAFYPFFYVALFAFLSRDELRKSLTFTLWFSAAHVAIVVVIALLPMETWQHNKLYDGIVFMFENDKVAQQIRPYEQQGFVLAADGYTPAAIASYHYGKNFFVFGEGSHYARQDDMVSDVRAYAGRDVLILKKSPPQLSEYAPYFQRVEVRSFALRGVSFYLVLGYGFDYAHYRETVLRQIKTKYYRIPDFLPHAPCYFCEKYFPGEAN